MIFRLYIELSGCVQGVGFRPFVYRLAQEEGLSGVVSNSPAGVLIDVEGSRPHLESFRRRLVSEKPDLAQIYRMESSWVECRHYEGFHIKPSHTQGEFVPVILPDLALCPECLGEVRDPRDRRFGYPFTNCTNCGPRYTIIEELPYDRLKTSMRFFTMCEACQKEYEDPMDRRFHAQPISCPQCGPQLSLWDAHGHMLMQGRDAAQVIAMIDEAKGCLTSGGILALLGIGGAQLLVDARNQEAVEDLRRKKQRDAKPFAVMLRDLDEVRQWAHCDEDEARILSSPSAPIVLLTPRTDHALATSVCQGSPWLGVMLPTTALHYLLLDRWDGIPVVTSGNLSDEPLCISQKECLDKLGAIADVLLLHDRPILRPVDDSVVRVFHGRELMLRRARGYAPMPVGVMDSGSDMGDVLAMGGQMKNAPAWLVHGQYVLSQHLGDMDTEASFHSLQATTVHLNQLLHAHPSCVAIDTHPDYVSGRWGRQIAHERQISVYPVQHHVAHVLSTVMENHVSFPVLGIAWDGTGYGSDATIWGGEFLYLHDHGWERVAAVNPFMLVGGDQAARHPERLACALLEQVKAEGESLPFLEKRVREKLNEKDWGFVKLMMGKSINSPRSSSMGRIFDAVSFLLGFDGPIRCEGQAAMRLEWWGWEVHNTRHDEEWVMDWQSIHHENGMVYWSWSNVLRIIERGLQVGVSRTLLAWQFHRGLARMIISQAKLSGLEKVCVGGGCFQNMLLLEMLLQEAKTAGVEVFHPQRVPAHDGGLALGQLGAVVNQYQS